jgi:hypothetical protein
MKYNGADIANCVQSKGSYPDSRAYESVFSDAGVLQRAKVTEGNVRFPIYDLRVGSNPGRASFQIETFVV